jgi:hypothetical protein
MKTRTLFKLVLVILAGLTLIEGRCLRCGIRRVGWALLNPRNQTCPKCGAGLEITQDGRPITTGYSPFQAEKYVIELPDSDTKSDGHGKNSSIKNNKQ